MQQDSGWTCHFQFYMPLRPLLNVGVATMSDMLQSFMTQDF